MSHLRELIGEAWVGPVHSAGREILRRIFVTVRDRSWSEIAPSEFRSVFDRRSNTVHLSARHTSDLVDFEWQGKLVVDEERRRLHFGFRGRALRDMDVCRLGLVVLHPLESLVGARLAVSDGAASQQITVARWLAPQPVIDGIPGAMTEPFSELMIEREDFGTLKLLFTGDRFEIEDQRNWGDASFKTYCTPLRNGFPRWITRGTVVEHTVDMQYTPAQDARSVSSRPSETILEATPSSFPTLGRIASRAGKPWAPPGQNEGWDHLHIDLTRQSAAALAEAFESSPDRCEIAIEPAAIQQPNDLLGVLRSHPDRIVRMMLYGRGVALPDASTVALWRKAVEDATGRAIPILAATRGYFVEFNRAVPPPALIGGVAFSLTGTVHGDDPELLISNAPAIRDMAATARERMGQGEIVIAPLALYHPPSAMAARVSDAIFRRWLAGTLRNAALAQVTSITFSDDVLSMLHVGPGPSSIARQLRDWMTASEH